MTFIPIGPLKYPLVRRASSDPRSHARCLLRDGAPGLAPAPTHLFYDNFTVDDDHPGTFPRTCNPGPGKIVKPDSGSVTITAGHMEWTAPSPASFTSHMTIGTRDDDSGIPREAGRMMLAKSRNTGDAGGTYNWGYRRNNNTAANNVAEGLRGSSSTIVIAQSDGSTTPTATVDGTPLAQNTQYDFAIVLKSVADKGAYYFIKGGVFTDWTLMFVTDHDASETLFPAMMPFNRPGTLDDWRIPVAKWSPPFFERTAFVNGFPADCSIGAADFIVDFDVTRGASGAGAANLAFRTSGSDGWSLTITNGSATPLFERNGSTAPINLPDHTENERKIYRFICSGNNVRAFTHVPGSMTWTAAMGTNPYTSDSGLASNTAISATQFFSSVVPIHSVRVYKRTWSGSDFPNV